MNRNVRPNTHYLNIVTAFYITLKLTAFLATYKIIHISRIEFDCGVVIIPFWFLTGSVIAEVYGYKTARQLIWTTLACQIFMFFIFYLITIAPSPPNTDYYKYQAYTHMFTTLLNGVIGNSIGIVLGAFVNARIMVSFNSLMYGKYFVVRCFLANALAEGLFVVFAYGYALMMATDKLLILHLMVHSYAIKMLLSPLLIVLAAFVSLWLKRLEQPVLASLTVGISKFMLNKSQHNIFTVKSSQVTGLFFSNFNPPMSTNHDLGKSSIEYNNVSFRFTEFNAGVSMQNYQVHGHQLLICLSGEVRIILENGHERIFTAGGAVFLSQLRCGVEILNDAKLVVINLQHGL